MNRQSHRSFDGGHLQSYLPIGVAVAIRSNGGPVATVRNTLLASLRQHDFLFT